jgi:hypothetical protein
MKRVFLAMTAVCALTAAAPAAAQYGSANANVGMGISNRITQLQSRIDAGVRAGTINRSEAFSLRNELRELSRLERQYSRNGLTVQERQDLQIRLRDLRDDVRLADGGIAGSDRYGSNDDRYDDDRYVGRADRDNDDWSDDDRYVGRLDRNNDGWDDRDRNRDGRIDNGYSGVGGPYEEADQCQTRGGIGGVLDNVLGNNCLRVGARVSGNLGAVPYEYRNQYRDGNGVYYRSDGRQIYQIDARTDTVVRIYRMDR